MPELRFVERSPDRGPKLRYQLNLPNSAARGAVLLTHGFGEHSERYDQVVHAWVERGLAVARYDLRGHGRSEGPRGHVVSFRDYVRDADDLFDELAHDAAWQAGGKPILFGHSLGGLISTHIALSGQSRYRGLMMTSPFFGLALEVSPVKLMLGRGMSRLVPRFAQPAGIKGEILTHDAELARQYDADSLGVKKVTARWFTEAVQAQADAFSAAPHLTLPLFVLAAGDDQVASTAAARRFVDAAGSRDKEIQVLDGQFHEVLNEVEREQSIALLADRMLNWL